VQHKSRFSGHFSVCSLIFTKYLIGDLHMEIIIVLVAISAVGIAWVVGKSKDKSPIDTWEPPKEMQLADKDKPWPYGEKLPEGKIHVKVADVAPVVTAPVLTVDGHGDVHEVKPAKKAPAKKTAAKPAVAKKAPAKKKSV
jgi:hypothetical protein